MGCTLDDGVDTPRSRALCPSICPPLAISSRSRPDLASTTLRFPAPHHPLQACHELVPPETLAPVLRQLVDQFVHDRWGVGERMQALRGLVVYRNAFHLNTRQQMRMRALGTSQGLHL